MKNSRKNYAGERTVALDIGNVCLKIYPQRCFEALGADPHTAIPDQFMDAVIKMEEGIIGEDEWLKTFREVTDYKFSENELRKAYISILGEEIETTADFIKDTVATDIRIIFFSDTSPIHLNHIFRNLSSAHLISGGVYSFETGIRKPDMKIYREYEKKYGKPLLYIDDKEENINAGRLAGWNSMLFEPESTHKNFYKEARQGRKRR